MPPTRRPVFGFPVQRAGTARSTVRTPARAGGRDAALNWPSAMASLLATGLIGLIGPAARADVACPPIFGPGMVLQRDLPVPVWGTAEPGEKVVVAFGGQTVETVAEADGRWRVALAPLSASVQPRTLEVRGSNRLEFPDVLVGEVWFLSGQSNMEKQLGPRQGQRPTDGYEAELARADCPALRLFQVPRHGRPKSNDGSLAWHACTAEALTRTTFSAAGYYFGRELVRELGVPVGLVHASYGGTRIEAWMPPEAFDLDPALAPLRRETYQAWVKGTQPTELYASMVAPFAPFAVRGFLWYQGESNCLNAEHLIYATKMRALIASWRRTWGRPDAPFYYAQLAPFAYSKMEGREKQLTPHALPALREAQIAALDAPHTGMVPTSDLAGDGSDLHPTNKRDVGLRFAWLALADTYGWRAEVQPPRFRAARDAGRATIEIEFAHAKGLHTRDGAPPSCWEIAGPDRIFHPAQATIARDRLRVSSPVVTRPVAVRFAWHELAMPNLVNGAGLPALPFRTDDWPLVLEAAKADEAAAPSRPN